MRNQEHCLATKVLLGQKAHPGLHAHMDELSKTLGWGHRLRRHDGQMVEQAGSLYGEDGEREAALHIACDMGVITKEDIEMSQLLLQPFIPRLTPMGKYLRGILIWSKHVSGLPSLRGSPLATSAEQLSKHIEMVLVG